MEGRREYLIKVISFTKLQGEAGPLGEGKAPSICIILQNKRLVESNIHNLENTTLEVLYVGTIQF